MATKIQVKRGTTAQVDAVTPVSGEPVWETDGLKLAIGDGATAGGKHVAMEATHVANSLFDAYTILMATTNDTPIALPIAEQTMVGRITGGNIAALTAAQVITLLGVPQFARAFSVIDLSGAAVSNIPILHTSRALTLLKAIILYTEATSADAGVTITIGKEATAAYYYTGTSEISKAQWYELDVTLLATDIAAGDTVICGCAGGKVGTGEVLICIEYKVA
uniref:Major tropism determinant N-terminal domain-containing protein n=1 Tax=viral metagenome TaxID=1070528 RepID=A0A6H2A0N1_9ZZZZ